MSRGSELAVAAWLPDLLRAMARDLGLPTALRFAAEFGGREIFVPMKATAEHKIAVAVGLPALRWLIKVRQPGEKLIVPLGPHSSYRARIVAARRMLDEGRSTEEIVRALQMHERSVRRHRSARRGKTADRDAAPDLFRTDTSN